MIRKLHIKNYALIDELEIDFSKGLTIITGETGAGKSILLGALGLIMGKRADTKSLYLEDKKCVVEGIFDIGKYGIKSFFEENDIDYSEELILRRELTPSGKSRAFVNDTPVNLTILKQLSSSLIDLHQQFDNLDIHQVSFQLRMIDALAGNKAILEQYHQKYLTYRKNEKRLATLRQKEADTRKELDYLNFLLAELEDINPDASEYAALEEKLDTLSHAEEIKTVLAAAHRTINEGELSILAMIKELSIAIGKITHYNTGIANQHRRLESIIAELEDLANELNDITDKTEYNEEEITIIRNRLDTIYQLQNKHNVTTVEELIQIKNDLSQKAAQFHDLSGEIAGLEKAITHAEKALKNLAETISGRRKEVIPSFEQKIHELLEQLSMNQAKLRVDIKPTGVLIPTGMDDINFLFTANKGSRFLPVKDVASGGELSRLTLVTKSLVAKAIPLPTLIFDEIDSGISGDVALKMGAILRRLANDHQVIVITHSPQVASKADYHYFIHKEEKENTTVTKIKLLKEEEKIRAIATMLSQNPPSKFALENAKELING